VTDVLKAYFDTIGLFETFWKFGGQNSKVGSLRATSKTPGSLGA
jgi:hypothetical protein